MIIKILGEVINTEETYKITKYALERVWSLDGVIEGKNKIFQTTYTYNYGGSGKYNQIEIGGIPDKAEYDKICLHFVDDSPESKIHRITFSEDNGKGHGPQHLIWERDDSRGLILNDETKPLIETMNIFDVDSYRNPLSIEGVTEVMQFLNDAWKASAENTQNNEVKYGDNDICDEISGIISKLQTDYQDYTTKEVRAKWH